MRGCAIVALGITLLFFNGPPPAAAQNHAQHYVLDAFGGVHAGGGAPVVSPATPYFGFDVAANIEYVPVGTGMAVGDGYLVLDKFGGVHFGGALATDPPIGTTPYFGFDAARSVVLRAIAPKMSSALAMNNPFFDNTNTTFTSVISTTIIAPTAGFLLVTSSAGLQCGTATGKARARMSLNVDSTSGDARVQSGNGYIQDGDCSDGANEVAHHSIQLTYPVAAGSHTAHLLYKHGGGDSFLVVQPSISAIFFDGS